MATRWRENGVGGGGGGNRYVEISNLVMVWMWVREREGQCDGSGLSCAKMGHQKGGSGVAEMSQTFIVSYYSDASLFI